MKKHKRRERITALELRRTAGCAPERRGSALLIVIGTLALVAVFAAVYVSIGRTDRRAANSLRIRIEQRDTSNQVGEYLAGVIGDDRLDALVQYDINGEEFGMREVTDAPYTDWSRRSEVNTSNLNATAFLFTPTGGPYRMEAGILASDDFRVASDPWLASTTPTYLGFPGDPSGTSGVDERPFSSYEEFNVRFPNSKNFLDQRDWLQISNFAPDGRPANLYNLRPTLPPDGFRGSTGAGSAVGGFDSEPGFGTSPRADGRAIRRMSNFLSLLNQETPGDPRSLLQAFDPAVDGVWVPGFNDPQLNIGVPADEIWNIPAVWTMYQRFMFMPMNQPFVINNRLGDESTWADPDYPPYQYADADGDGFADSRWFELRSARDAGQGAGTTNRDDISTLFDQGDFRYFIAARAVDLSSMVNVNTATDQLVPPTVDYPMGLTPADVDLRRLLTMQDPASDYTSVLSGSNTGIPLSLQAIPRPYTLEPELAYPRDWNGNPRGDDFLREVTDYNYYQTTINPLTGGLDEIASNSPSLLIGRYAYDALRRGIAQGRTIGNDFRGYDIQSVGPQTFNTTLVQYQTDPFDNATVPGQINNETRFNQYMRVGRLDPTNSALSWAQGDSGINTYGSGLYGLDDLSELLTYHGLNDPDFTSRLEQIVSGRYESETNDYLQSRRLSPLLSNRDLTLDRFSHSRILDIEDMRVAPSPEFQSDPSRIGEVSRNAMALMKLSPRKFLTTLSGFVPLAPGVRLMDAAVPTALDASSALPTLSDLLGNPNQLFDLYSDTLAGGLTDVMPSDWQTDPAMFEDQDFSTLFYGYRGPELGLRIAAHTAVNMTDIADNNTDVTVATLLVDSNLRADMINENNFDDPLADALYQLYPGVANGALFDPDPNDTIPLPNNVLDDKRQLVNVFGVEAMPVITEVSTMYVYHDAIGSDFGGPGDNDYDSNFEPSGQVGGLILFPAPGEAPNITINGTREVTNPDYLGQVLAFQLHNPYGKPISLGGNALNTDDPLTRQRDHDNQDNIDQDSNYQFDYYIEFAGRFYKLAQYIEWYPTDMNIENYYSIDDPINTVAYGTVPNPEDDYPAGSVGGYLQPGIETSASSVPGVYANPLGYFSDFNTRNVVLRPGETRVFYVLAEKRFDDATPFILSDSNALDDKWTRTLGYYGDLHRDFQDVALGARDTDLDGLPDGAFGDSRGWTGPAEQWVEKHLHVRRNANRPVMMMEFDPRDGKLLNEETPISTVLDPTSPAPDPLFMDRNDELEVRLWKKIVTNGEETDEQDTSNPNINPTYRNLIQNDLLVDRLTLPDSLAMEMNVGPVVPMGVEVEDTVSYRENFPTTINGRQIRNDNTGISVVNWKTVRRVDSETATLEDIPATGEVTPWMLRSATSNPDLAPIVHTPLDLVDASVLNGARVVDNNNARVAVTPISGFFETHRTIRELVDTARTTNGEEIIQTLSLEPHFKSDPSNDPGGLIEDDVANLTADKYIPDPLPVLDTALEDRATVMFTGGDAQIADRPRLADLLLAWGAGPSFSPDPTRALGSTEYVEEEWQTLPEIMAEVLGFGGPVPAPMDEARSAWLNAWDTTTQQGILDDGHLALDRFVPFINTDAGPGESPPEFDVFGVTGTQDILRGAGVPMALGVIDRARAIERLERVTDPINASGVQLDELNLTRPTFGTININTAPVEVLRLLPGFSPSKLSYVDEMNTVKPEWWGARYLDTQMPTAIRATNNAGLLENPDVASSIVAYRDRLYGFPTTATRPELLTSNTGVLSTYPLYLSPEVSNLDKMTQNMIGEVPTASPPMNESALDRSIFTGIEGLRSTPGFGSLGELLSVRVDPEFSLLSGFRWDRNRQLSIDQLGYDEKAQGAADGPDGVITAQSQIFDANRAGTTVDDYAEKLIMANGVLNMLSVRSDYYAVWFVLQGYKESDVGNLRPEDPLIPSVHKRYIMVVDRSNVIEPGDKPKIVMLKEIPL